MTEQIKKYAESRRDEQPFGMTWADVSRILLREFGPWIIVAAVACFALWLVYGQWIASQQNLYGVLKEQNASLYMVISKNTEALNRVAKVMEENERHR